MTVKLLEDLCKRTAAIYKPGVPMSGMKCWYSWSGKMPLTGVLRCPMCGRVKAD